MGVPEPDLATSGRRECCEESQENSWCLRVDMQKSLEPSQQGIGSDPGEPLP